MRQRFFQHSPGGHGGNGEWRTGHPWPYFQTRTRNRTRLPGSSPSTMTISVEATVTNPQPDAFSTPTPKCIGGCDPPEPSWTLPSTTSDEPQTWKQVPSTTSLPTSSNVEALQASSARSLPHLPSASEAGFSSAPTQATSSSHLSSTQAAKTRSLVISSSATPSITAVIKSDVVKDTSAINHNISPTLSKTSTSNQTSATPVATESTSRPSLSTDGKVAIILGIFLVSLIIVVLSMLFLTRKRRRARLEAARSPYHHTPPNNSALSISANWFPRPNTNTKRFTAGETQPLILGEENIETEVSDVQ